MCICSIRSAVIQLISLSAEDFARLYKKNNLEGGHVIKLGPGNDDAALEALRAWPGQTTS